MDVFETSSPDETFLFGQQLAKLISNGDVICLSGNLGAGKTVFVKGVADGLASDDVVTSPTFTIIHVYEGRLPIYHFDLYRLDHQWELADVGFYEYASGENGLAIIEWPEKFPEELPDEYLWIDIKEGNSAEERLLYLKPRGVRYEKLCEELKDSCSFSR